MDAVTMDPIDLLELQLETPELAEVAKKLFHNP